MLRNCIKTTKKVQPLGSCHCVWAKINLLQSLCSALNTLLLFQANILGPGRDFLSTNSLYRASPKLAPPCFLQLPVLSPLLTLCQGVLLPAGLPPPTFVKGFLHCPVQTLSFFDVHLQPQPVL